MTDLPRGYRWADPQEYNRADAIIIPRTDSQNTPYTQDNADIAVPIHPHRKALIEMMAANIHGGDHHIKLTMNDAAILATNLAPLVERIIDARVHRARKEIREEIRQELEDRYAG